MAGPRREPNDRGASRKRGSAPGAHRPVVSAATARRLLLGAQGLLADPSGRVTPSRLLKLVEQLGFVQVDSIHTVERAHHLTLASRLDDYESPMLARLVEKRRALFEHWTHDASVIPTRWFPHWKPRFERDDVRFRANRWWRERFGGDPQPIFDDVLKRIQSDGPLLARDFDNDDTQPRPEGGAWWGWKREKAALEMLWRTGRLAITRREGFQKVYDLMERVLPDAVSQPATPSDALTAWAASTALERLGVATEREVAAYWGAVTLAEARAWCRAAEARGEVIAVDVETADGKKRPAYARADFAKVAARLPEPPDRMRLLSPFDPVIRDRDRAARLFGFDYRFEAFVPAPKRVYGYYVFPILEGDRLVGRAEPKFHRERGALELRGVWWEKGVKADAARKKRLREALERLAKLVGAQSLDLGKATAR